jgi:predicted DNA-binding transcriptional regulator YafY
MIDYRDNENRLTQRLVWPIVVGYYDAARVLYDAARVLVGWCGLRRDFRNFRIDRITNSVFLEDRFPGRPSALRAKWLAHFCPGRNRTKQRTRWKVS